MKIEIPRFKRAIDHMIPEEGHPFSNEYLKHTSEHLFGLQGMARSINSTSMNPIARDIGRNDVTKVYEESMGPDFPNYRIWKVRQKKDRKSRNNFHYEAFLLRWLNQRGAHVPDLVALVEDVNQIGESREELKKEMQSRYKGKENEEALEREIKRRKANVPLELLVISKLKDPRLDMDLIYLEEKKKKEEDRNKKNKIERDINEAAMFSLQSIVDINVIANHYKEEDFRDNEDSFRIAEPYKEGGYLPERIKTNLERIYIHNLVSEKLIDVNDVEKIKAVKLPKDIADKADKLFSLLNKNITEDAYYMGFLHGECQTFHLAYSESPDKEDAGKLWKGYHLFDFDKSHIGPAIYDIVTFLNNPFNRFTYEAGEDMFMRSLCHGLKRCQELGETQDNMALPVKIKKNLSQEEQKTIASYNMSSKKEHVASILGMVSSQNLQKLVKMKDYLTLYIALQNIGRSCKREYGEEFQGYVKMPKGENYRSRLSEGRTEPIPYEKYHSGKNNRKAYADILYDTLDKMAANESKYYKLNKEETKNINDIKEFLSGTEVSFGDMKIQLKLCQTPEERE